MNDASPQVRGDSHTLKRFVKLDNELRTAEEKVKKLKAEIEKLEPGVMKYFQRMGQQSATIGGLTVYIRKQLWAGREQGVTADAAYEKLQSAGWGEYATRGFNTQELSARVRELEIDERKDDEPVDPLELVKSRLPKMLQGIIKITEKFSVQTRKA